MTPSAGILRIGEDVERAERRLRQYFAACGVGDRLHRSDRDVPGHPRRGSAVPARFPRRWHRAQRTVLVS